ncbi:hypothetical protein ACH4O1_33405, partial [Streptomyces lydicus]
ERGYPGGLRRRDHTRHGKIISPLTISYGTGLREEWIVRGHGASQPNPQGEFRRVKRFPLVGDHPVGALVELVPDQVTTAEVLMAAELEHRNWGVRRYRARLEPSPHAILLRG